jgi:putative endonuclease
MFTCFFVSQKRLMTWYTYILICADNSLYTGITTDLAKRLKAHNNGTAAKYTRGRLPVRYGWHQAQTSESAARQLEAKIKRLPRHKKLPLISS